MDSGTGQVLPQIYGKSSSITRFSSDRYKQKGTQSFFVINFTSAFVAGDDQRQNTQILMGRATKGMRRSSYEFDMLGEKTVM